MPKCNHPPSGCCNDTRAAPTPGMWNGDWNCRMANADWGDRLDTTHGAHSTAQPAGRVGTFPFCRKFMHVFSTWHLPATLWECICLARSWPVLASYLNCQARSWSGIPIRYDIWQNMIAEKTHVSRKRVCVSLCLCMFTCVPLYLCVCVCLPVSALGVAPICMWQLGISVAQLINWVR